MNRITPQERPTFKVAHSYRSHGFISRETFLSFQKTFEEIVTTIVNIKVCKDEDDLWKYVRSLFDSMITLTTSQSTPPTCPSSSMLSSCP